MVLWADFLNRIPLSVSADVPIRSVMTDKNLHRMRPDQRGKVMYFRADPGKITKAPIISATILKTVVLTPHNKFFNRIYV